MYKILVIDDLKPIYLTVNKILSEKNCEVHYAENGNKGIQMASVEIFDLILLDVNMPDINGIEVCRIIKKNSAYQHIPILFLTSDSASLTKGFEAGGVDYIIKPFNENELTVRVFTQISLSVRQIQLEQEKKILTEDLTLKEVDLIGMKKELDHYFYQTSHRLRAPLNSIRGLLQLIKYESPDIFNSEYIQLCIDSFEKMVYTNEQMSQIGYIRDVTPAMESIKLNEYITQIIEKDFSGNKIIQVDIPSELKVLADIRLLSCGMKPIIANALFYTSFCDKPKKEIKIIAEKSGANTILKITDFACGIVENRLDKLKEMFYVGDLNSNGNGLGLYISEMALNKMNIKLKIESVLNEGTTAHVIF